MLLCIGKFLVNKLSKSMKVILLRDVAKIGRRFEIKEVPDGYAQNQLIPKKYAEPATAVAIKRIAELKNKHSINNDLEKVKLQEVEKACQAEPLEIIMEANEQGHLFKSVRASDVAKTAKVRGLFLPESNLQFASAIKSLGRHEAFIELRGERFIFPLEVVVKNK